MDTNYYKQYEPFFNAWYIKRLIGEGSFGQVYEIERKELGITYHAALKTITIPQSQSEVKSIMADGMSKADVTTYYKGVVQDIISEFVLLSKLKGNSNIVSYEDHVLMAHKEGVGWDILIRMELLTPLFEYIEQNDIKRRDIIKLGIDLCKALELCQKYNIIHRDVKPENIFLSPNGDFKLGDFGIARTVEKTTSGLSRKGTYTYMAPEIYRGEAYGSTVDIYSLGIVMYRLLNDNRTPFLPAYPKPITHNDRESALMKRIGGKELPPPINAEGRLKEIVLKACAYHPKERYSSARQMRRELEEIFYEEQEAVLAYPKGDTASINPVEYVSSDAKTDGSLKNTGETTAPEQSGDEKTVSLYGSEDETVSLYDGEGETSSLPEDPAIASASEEEDPADAVHDESAEPERLQEDGEETVSLLTEAAETSKAHKAWEGSEEKTESLADLQSALNSHLPTGSQVKKKDEPAEKDKPAAKKSGKKIIIGILIGILVVIGVVAAVICARIPKEITAITGLKNPTSIYLGDSLSPKYKIEPERFADEKLSFSTADGNIASIDEKGTITGNGIGETTITLSALDFKKEINITVNAKVTNISNVDDKLKIKVGDSKQLEPKLEPEEFANEAIAYSVSDAAIATVSADGKIEAKKKGATQLTISAGGSQKTVEITVYKPEKKVKPTKKYVPPTKSYVAPTQAPTRAYQPTTRRATQPAKKSTKPKREEEYWE